MEPVFQVAYFPSDCIFSVVFVLYFAATARIRNSALNNFNIIVNSCSARFQKLGRAMSAILPEFGDAAFWQTPLQEVYPLICIRTSVANHWTVLKFWMNK